MKRTLSLLLTLALLFVICGAAHAEGGAPLKISIYYNDNPTYPFRDDWLALTYIEETYNVDLEIEPVPFSDYGTKVNNVLTSQGDDTPDVIFSQKTSGGIASLALNGAIYAISDNPDWTPNFNARVAEFGLEEELETCRMSDGRLYYMPAMYDIPVYDGGLILRQDYLEAKGFEAPGNFDDLYTILKAYKEDYPDSYPLTTIYDVGFLERMTMPSWGLSLGTYNSTSSQVLSWDYENRAYFAGAISRQYRDYITFLHRLYAEGLLDPEMTQDDASTTLKLATGASMAVYAFYDQIGGWEQASEIEGFRLALYPPLTGPSGAHHMPKARLMNGIIFPVKTTQREDFEQVVRKIDEILFSEDAYMVWSLGLEGKTYTMDGDQVVFSDDILNAPEGITKYMQNAYGCGCGGTQCVFRSALEMFKNKSDFAAVNTEVAAMDQAMQYVPAAPAFDDLTAEDTTLLQGALGDAYAVWNDAFIRGTRDIDADWDTYVQEMKDKGMDEYLALFNQFSRYQ